MQAVARMDRVIGLLDGQSAQAIGWKYGLDFTLSSPAGLPLPLPPL